jgi:transposase
VVLLHLSDEDRFCLEGLLRKGTLEQRVARRASIILELGSGSSVVGTARKLGLNREQVALWRNRFLEGGLALLEKDRPRPGKPKTISKSQEEAVLTLTRMTTPENGTHWSVRTMAEAAGVSKASVQRIWAAHGLKPHLILTFKLSKYPKFDEKLVDVV